jgi:hypothetical protein
MGLWQRSPQLGSFSSTNKNALCPIRLMLFPNKGLMEAKDNITHSEKIPNSKPISVSEADLHRPSKPYSLGMGHEPEHRYSS